MKHFYADQLDNLRHKLYDVIRNKVEEKGVEIQLEDSIVVLTLTNSFSMSNDYVGLYSVGIEDNTLVFYDEYHDKHYLDDIISLEDLAIVVDNL
jgi:hypothetical protein